MKVLSQICSLAILFIPLFTSCSQNNELALGFKLGSSESEWKAHLNELVSSGKLFDQEFNIFQGYLIIKKDTLLVDYSINRPYPTTGLAIYSDDSLYMKGNLRSIEINLEGDSICSLSDRNTSNMRYIRKAGPVAKRKVDLVKQYLISLYGKPSESSDSLELANKELLDAPQKSTKKRSIAEIIEQRQKEVSVFNTTYIDKWILKDFDIELIREHPYYDNCFGDTMHSAAHIAFKSKAHDTELELIKSSIRNRLKAKDYVDFFWNKPNVKTISKNQHWQVFEIEQPLFRLSRTGPEDLRKVTDIKFDIVYYNRFGEEICRMTNCTYKFTSPLAPAEGCSGDISYSVRYTNKEGSEKSFGYIINNIDDFRIRVDGKSNIGVDVHKIVLDDGSIIE